MIAVVDYGMGNLKSVINGFRRLGGEVKVTSKKGDLYEADGIVLPGVGSFGKCVKNLENLELFAPLRELILKGKPYLGICLGMQLLFEESEESPGIQGLSILKGKVVRFPSNLKLKVPHMGWNGIKIKKEHGILKGIKDNAYFYFVHSYYCIPEEEDVVATTTNYGVEFASSVQKGNLFACQFHPEKSQRTGLMMLKNFIEMWG
ncbi:MAG: imidazole glycerol phosphate synthase subunit HisH [Syntrophorhabdaceae bacterium]|nr:imidazole glycerol phosphate synthase subunit HisH [Syntrophorhabdaceae bacterium]